jgi:hypothetical protein
MRKWLFLLRAFFPSWRFFDDVGPELRLEIRFGKNEAQFGRWQNALPPIRRSLTNLPVNPQGNFLHACHNLLNHLSGDIQESQDLNSVPELATYKLVRNLARFQVFERMNPPFQFQFRLSASLPGREGEQILLSPIYGSEG